MKPSNATSSTTATGQTTFWSYLLRFRRRYLTDSYQNPTPEDRAQSFVGCRTFAIGIDRHRQPTQTMDPLTVKLELPRDLLGALDVAEEELEPRLKMLIALELFREGRISSGKAAELLGQSKEAFVGLLDRHGIAYFSETPSEFTAQVADVERKLNAPASS